MKKIRIALSIAALLGTMAVVGLSDSRVDVEPVKTNPPCNCENENPHSWGIYDAAHQCVNVSCNHPVGGTQ